MYHDGVWISGFNPIIKYLTGSSLVADLDTRLTSLQRADVAAYSAHLSVHASCLLDLSLYVSAANWAETTRPAYSALLPFPLTWTIPTLIRADAIARASRLGLAELDSDLDPNSGLHLSSGVPESFRRHLPLRSAKKSVTEEMTPEQAAAIRLHGVAENCLGALEEALGEDGRFFDDSVTSLDCLAFGYLALLLLAPVPRAFARDWIDENAPRIRALVNSMQASLLTQKLSWEKPQTRTWSAATARVVDSVVRHAPNVGEHYAAEMRYRNETGAKGFDTRALLMAAGALVTSAAVSSGVVYYRSLPHVGLATQTWHSPGAARLSQFGQLGSMLNSALGPMPSYGGRVSEVE